MAAAVDILQTTEGTKEHSRISEQRDLFIRLFHNSGIPVALNGPAGQWRHPGNANLRFRGFAAEDILGSVQPQLAASTGAACASGIPEPSHVLRAMGLSNAEASSSIRFSFGRFTTNNEVDYRLNPDTEALGWARVADAISMETTPIEVSGDEEDDMQEES